jgi:hypothetical protein
MKKRKQMQRRKKEQETVYSVNPEFLKLSTEQLITLLLWGRFFSELRENDIEKALEETRVQWLELEKETGFEIPVIEYKSQGLPEEKIIGMEDNTVARIWRKRLFSELPSQEIVLIHTKKDTPSRADLEPFDDSNV